MIYKGVDKVPYMIAMYGNSGVGKTTSANSASKPVFFNFEDGLHHIDCYKTPLITSLNEFKDYLGKVTYGEHSGQFKTIVIDTIDALEDLLSREICQNHKKESLGSFGFGQGFDLLNKKWLEILSMLDIAKRKFKMNIILVGHDQIKRYEDPMGEGYDRIILKMNHRSALTLISKVDAVLYMTWDKVISKDNDNDKAKAIGTGRRIIYSVESPAFVAKNRYGLQPRFEVDQNFFKNLENKIYPNEALSIEPVED